MAGKARAATRAQQSRTPDALLRQSPPLARRSHAARRTSMMQTANDWKLDDFCQGDLRAMITSLMPRCSMRCRKRSP
jgi:hypothetical protein